jgi:hypothetical protein
MIGSAVKPGEASQSLTWLATSDRPFRLHENLIRALRKRADAAPRLTRAAYSIFGIRQKGAPGMNWRTLGPFAGPCGGPYDLLVDQHLKLLGDLHAGLDPPS